VIENMFELQGKYGTAKVFTDDVDPKAISQVVDLLNQPYAAGSKIRMMPDIHAGAGCTIGTTMTITDKVCPNLVGVDIGCGMYVAKVRGSVDPERLDAVIRRRIPAGFVIHSGESKLAGIFDFGNLRCKDHVDVARAKRSIGTLGGGNHFIEADRDDAGNTYIVIHSGSRHLGVEVANYYQNAGFNRLQAASKSELEETISMLKDEHRYSEIEEACLAFKQNQKKLLKELAYVDGELLQDYLQDMVFVQLFASVNRQAMMSAILEDLNLKVEKTFETIHNYVDLGDGILRKGAVSAKLGEKLIIPINMRDGSLICIGKGNEDWNCSAPHGAGRLFSRSEAKERFSVDEFKDQMRGIYSTSIGRSTLDECPMAYKSMQSIVDNIEPTVEIQDVIRPFYNFKA
jgi:RNA-splicing ligase RtcB